MKPGAKPMIKQKTKLTNGNVSIYTLRDGPKIIGFETRSGDCSSKFMAKPGPNGIVDAFKAAQRKADELMPMEEKKKLVAKSKRKV